MDAIKQNMKGDMTMIELKQFAEMSGAEKCALVNRVLEERGKKGFKGGEIGFTWSAAEKILKEQGIYEIEGKYRTAEQAIEFLNAKKAEEQREELTQENIVDLLKLLEKDRFEKLLKLADKYDYVAHYILRADKGVKVRRFEGKAQVKSFRVYDDTRERWSRFIEGNKEVGSVELFNTALVEFMERYGY